MKYNFEYVGNDTWRFSVLLRSGQTVVREGQVERLSRLALRAQRLLDHWSGQRTNMTTLPLTRPTRPATPSAVRSFQVDRTPAPMPSDVRAARPGPSDERRASDFRSREHPDTMPSLGVPQIPKKRG